MPRDLTDRVLVITGASSGIGAAVALEAADAGMHVTLAARRADKLMHVAKQVADRGLKAHFFTCNVANPQDVRRLFDETLERFGRVDAAFANAGYGMEQDAHTVPLADHRRLFEVNYWGTVYTLHEALRAMTKTADGLNHLLVTSSCLSEMGPPQYGPYAATKAAQDCLAQAMRAELHDRGYDVTTVHPVLTKTEFFDAKADAPGSGDSQNQRTAEEVYSGPFVQTAEHVARKVVATLRKPKAEVWPAWWSRYAFAAATACPTLTAWALRKAYAKQRDPQAKARLQQAHIEQAQAAPNPGPTA